MPGRCCSGSAELWLIGHGGRIRALCTAKMAVSRPKSAGSVVRSVSLRRRDAARPDGGGQHHAGLIVQFAVELDLADAAAAPLQLVG